MTEYGEKDHVRIERAGDTVHVTLCNPEARNAQTPATWRRLASVPALLTPDVRAVVLRGEGVSFSAGLDRRMLSPEGVPGEESLLTLATYDDEQIDALHRAGPGRVRLVAPRAAGDRRARAGPRDRCRVPARARLRPHDRGRRCEAGDARDLPRAGARPRGHGAPGGASGLLARLRDLRHAAGTSSADEAVRLGHRRRPRARWASGTPTSPSSWRPILAAMPGAVSELKHLLAGADTATDQLARERAAQIRRLTELRTLLGGSA